MGLNGALIPTLGIVKEIEIKGMLGKKEKLYFLRKAQTSLQHTHGAAETPVRTD